MKEIVVKNTKGQLFREKLMVFLLIGFCAYLFVNQIISAVDANKAGLVEDSILVSSVEDISGQYVQIHSSTNEIVYYCYDTTLTEKLSAQDVIQVKAYVTDNYWLLYVVSGTNVNYDTEQDFYDQNTRSIWIAAVILVLLVGYLTYVVVSILKKPLEERFDAIEYQLSINPILTNKMLPKKCKTRKSIDIYNACCAVLLGSFVLIMLFYNTLFNLLGDLFYVCIGIYGGIALIGVGVLVFLRPQLTTKGLQQFVSDYKDYLVNGGGEDFNLAYTVCDEGIKYTSQNNEQLYTYEDLRLYTVGLFGKGFFACNLFIASDIVNLDEKDVDLVIPLTHGIYKALKDHNVNVNGLDDVINNLGKEIIENSKFVKKNGKVVKYNK